MIRTKRAYEPAADTDGTRVLVDRLWPRGISKSEARIDRWERELAPSKELRTWYGHDPTRFAEFRRRYLAELRPHREALNRLAREGTHTTVTLVYASRDAALCNAGVLKEVLGRPALLGQDAETRGVRSRSAAPTARAPLGIGRRP